MANLSDYFENAIINQMRNTLGPQVDAYVALFTGAAATALEDDNPTTEVTGGDYGRQPAGLIAPTNGVSENGSEITFPTATASWGEVTHVALVNDVSDADWGNTAHVLMWSALDSSKTIDTDDVFKINAGELDVTIT